MEKMEERLDQIDVLLSPQVAEKVKKSIEIIEEALDKYSLERLSISFNGGKDCTALLHLIHMILLDRNNRNGKKETKPCQYLKSVCFLCNNPFDQVIQFIQQTEQVYGLRTVTMNEPIKEGLRDWMNDSGKECEGIFMGSRRTDPYCAGLHYFDPTETEKGWPQIMRINAIIDWNYADLWAFMRAFQVEYCSLYELGYTSLGSKNNTKENPHLQKPEGNGFFPAYHLVDDLKERAGRGHFPS